MRAMLQTATLLALCLPILTLTGCSCEDEEAAAASVRTVGEVQVKPAGAGTAAPAKKPPTEPDHVPGQSIIHAPGDYMTTVAVTAPRKAIRETDMIVLTKAIERFEVIEGRYPDSLDELARWLGEDLPDPPARQRYDYDPRTGKVTIVPIQ